MVQQKLVLKTYKIKSNQPFLLLNPQVVWLVISGQVSVFATQVSNYQPIGERRYLFTVNPGEILCGIEVTQELGMLAVALEDVELQRLDLDDIDIQFATKNLRAITFLVSLEDWLKKLGKTLALESLQKTLSPENTTLAPCTLPTPYSLETNQLIQPPPNQIVWVKVIQGQTSWQGFSDLLLDGDSPWFPLVKGMWLTTQSPTEIKIIPTFQYLDRDLLTASLAIFHEYFCYALNLYLKEQKKAEFDHFQAREELNQQLTASALGKLASVLQPQHITVDTTGTPLLIALGAIGRVQKIKIQPPAASEDLNLLQDPIEAIARASQCRIRRVQLVGNWWQSEHGAILAYTTDNHSPVA
ncbi:MAG: hypothetical protein WBM86_27615, partial [Waterburya sp.]